MIQSITAKFRHQFGAEEYPRQFWLMFWGMMISTVGSSMIWPFMMIYASSKLALSLTLVASLMTVSSIMGLVSSFIAGPVIDRLGRKWVMVISLLLNAAGYFILSQATTLPGFMLGMAINGTFNPLYRVGADAMLADLIPADKRVNAYSLMRMSNNVGVALGPAIGGFIAAISYTTAFYCASAGLTCFSLLIAFFAVETLPARAVLQAQPAPDRGYSRVLHDKHFLLYSGLFTLVQMCSALIWVLLSVYTKKNFGIPESAYGLLPTTNALMVVFFQFSVSQITRRYPPLRMMVIGASIYAAATFSIAFGGAYWAFWLSMVVMTVGELILVPTSSTYVANMAPPEMRGRYMSIYGLTWGVASGISPVFGGFLSDTLGTRSPWFAGGLIGLSAVVGFILLSRHSPAAQMPPEPLPEKASI